MNFLIAFFTKSSFIITISIWIYLYYIIYTISIPEIFNQINLNSNFPYKIFILLPNCYLMTCQIRSLYKLKSTDSYLKDNNQYYGKAYMTKDNKNQHKSNDELTVNNNTNLCKKCEIERNNRVRHCSICNKCTILFDHHCLILDSCVGQRNFKYFVSYVLIALFQFLLFVIIIYFSIKKYYSKILQPIESNDINENEYMILNNQFIYKLKYWFYLVFSFPLKETIAFFISLIGFCLTLTINIFNLISIKTMTTWTERKYKLFKERDPMSWMSLQRLIYNYKSFCDCQSIYELFWAL